MSSPPGCFWLLPAPTQGSELIECTHISSIASFFIPSEISSLVSPFDLVTFLPTLAVLGKLWPNLKGSKTSGDHLPYPTTTGTRLDSTDVPCLPRHQTNKLLASDTGRFELFPGCPKRHHNQQQPESCLRAYIHCRLRPLGSSLRRPQLSSSGFMPRLAHSPWPPHVGVRRLNRSTLR